MSKGISLSFDKDGKPTLDEAAEKLDCFGGVTCEHAEHEEFEIDLDDGRKIPARSYFCRHANKPVTDYLWTECPIGRWKYLKNYRYTTEAQLEVLNILWGEKRNVPG
jgi:hypothetical protein